MKNYRVILEGKNFLLDLDGTPRKYGFYATRDVQASGTEEAELKAVQAVREDSELARAVMNAADDAPMIDLHEMTELISLAGVAAPGSGYSFYQDDAAPD